MRIALVGWGVETKSAFRYFGTEHKYLIVSEEPREDFPTGNNINIRSLSTPRKPGLTSTVTDYSYLNGLENFDKVVYTPTSRKNLEKIYPSDSPFWKIAKSSLELFFENLPTKNTIGVTGTKGKGTTSTLIAELLKSTGKKVHLGGNIGIPVLDLLPHIEENDWVVLELSSFQLYKFPYSPHIAVHLMMVPEHIEEWHKTMDDYVKSKRTIFTHQNSEDIAIFYPENQYSKENATYSQGKHIPYGVAPGAYVSNDKIIIDNTDIIDTTNVGLVGSHNVQNICAALTAAWQVSKQPEHYAQVLTEFQGLEHRLQLVREVNGVKYYDDSFGTTPDTAVVALDAFFEPKVIIVGGHDKGNDYTTLAKRLIAPDVTHVIFIGTTGHKILDLAVEYGFDASKATIRENGNSWTMKEMVLRATEVVEQNGVVLLSTGSASFGLFKDYKDRGNQFIDAVNQL